MKRPVFFIIMYLLNSSLLFSQVAVNTDGHDPDASAILDVESVTKGILIPRMTVEARDAIPSPAEGLMIFCTNCGSKGSLSIFSAGSWQTFSPCEVSPPGADANYVFPGQITWRWTAIGTGSKWGITNNFDGASDVGTALSNIEAISGCGMTLTRYVWSYNTCAVSPVTVLSEVIPSSAPDSPQEGVHVPTINQITWNWAAVSGATGYKWNTINDLITATDVGVETTKTQTGLTCSSASTSYVWAYNGCGYSAAEDLQQSTNECCGSTMTITHLVSEGVAPVDKTVTYGIVTGLSGEPEKCWITSNLGADHQATAVDDATEASAGWYWQFNRMQGYMAEGSVTTPTWTITSIDEDSDWLEDNDPCHIELGTGWRLPTSIEWLNVMTAGSWTDWTGPFGSALQMHAAGFLESSSGSLNYSGIYGFYWSNSTDGYSMGMSLVFYDGICYLGNNQKSSGLPIRCLRE
jgi:hypothetical protein